VVRNGPIETRSGVRRRLAWLISRPRNRRVRVIEPPVKGTVVATGPDDPTAKTRASRGSKALTRAGIALGLCATLGGGGFGLWRWVTRSEKFALHTVRVSPTRHLTADQVRARAGLVPGKNLFSLDLPAARRALLADPWLAAASLTRELPDRVAIDVTEREPACTIALGPLYLADGRGEVFKRATPDEAAGLPVVTGVARAAYVDDREAAQALVRQALTALSAWRERAERPAIGEVHVDAAAGVTLYTAHELTGVRLGAAPDGAALQPRLARYDAVAAALRESGDRPRLILLDSEARPDRVTVRIATR
jgi:cell division protein FtsQ